MTRLFLVKDGERELWVAALVDEDVWTYVAETGKFHRNEGARHDYYFLNELEYVEIGIRCFGKGIFHKQPITGFSVGTKRVLRIEPVPLYNQTNGKK
jgi:hypothetical protein